MWVLHPDPVEQVADGGCRIWIRSSQNKISLPGPVPDSRKIFELLAPLGVTGPSRLSAQSIVNLTHDGVHDEVIRKLMAHGLQEEIKDLVDWSKPESMVRVWRTVEKAGCVVTSHIQRGAAGEARALGIGKLRQSGKQEHIRVESIGIEPEAALPFVFVAFSSGAASASSHRVSIRAALAILIICANTSSSAPLELRLCLRYGSIGLVTVEQS
ncbi:hypothetical protein EDD15DRAFT_2383294 [Pisolithus albus]|nr:hypothetical protein EDD15DRAFT_2383294 [Pisolithus albus]